MPRQISPILRLSLSRLVTPILTVTLALSGAEVAASEPVPAPVKNPAPADLERATELYDNGKGLYEEGSYEGAAMAFIQAYELSGDIDLLYNVSLAYDRAENFAEALRYLEAYRALAPKDEREGLGKKVDSLKIRLAKQEAEEEERAAAGPSEEPSGEDPKEPSDERADSSALTDGSGQPTAGRPQRIFTPLAGVFTGLTVAGFAVGTGLGLSSRAATKDVESQCNGPLCQGAANDDLDRAKTRAIIADVAFGVGAASAIGLIVVLAVNASKRKRAGSTALLVPTRRGAAVSVTF